MNIFFKIKNSLKNYILLLYNVLLSCTTIECEKVNIIYNKRRS